MPPKDSVRNGDRDQDRQQTCIIRESSKCFEHRESQATAMTVDFTGGWVLLAGRRHLSLQSLGQDDVQLRKYVTNSKYKVSAAEFAICPQSKESCAIATSQHIDVVTWGAAEPRYIHSLRGHTRVVTDIDWHSKNSNLLVSCSVDTFSHIWDLRDSRKPTLSLSAVCMSGATQVGFNRVSGNLLAAAHDGDLRIWDIRKGSCPIHYITAHLNRVHGINWSHRCETCLATASQDGTVKYFDINNPRRAEKIITAASPVWRARYTPIGNGLVSIVVPYLGRGENSLLLWSNSKQYDPICSFVGHTDVILDFAWRTSQVNHTEIELVTWSRDRTLRIWKIDENMLKLCESDSDGVNDTNEANSTEYSTDRQTSDEISLTAKPNTQSAPSFSSNTIMHKDSSSTTRSLSDQANFILHNEFSLLSTNMPHIEIETLDANKRIAIFRIAAGGHVVILRVTFPIEYPNLNTTPVFTFNQGTTLHDHLARTLLKVLNNNSLQRVKKSRTCLEQCLKALVAALKKSSGPFEKSQFHLQSPRLEGALTGAIHDACIPFPRMSGVMFNTVGLLCTFAQSLKTKRLTLRHENTTPRSLSAINGGGLLGNVMGPQPVLYTHRDSNASFYLNERMITGKHAKNRCITKSRSTSPIVLIYKSHRLLNVSRNIAQEYSLNQEDISKTCSHNRKVCESNGRFDLVPIWTLAEMIATPDITCSDILMSNDPFKKHLLDVLIMHFAKIGDIQTAVTLVCLFHNGRNIVQGNDNVTTTLQDINIQSNSNRLSSGKITLGINNLLTTDSQQRNILSKYFWCDSNDGWMLDRKLARNITECRVGYNSLITSHKMPLYDQFKKVYAEILYGWQLLITRTLILKHTMVSKYCTEGIEFVVDCPGCYKSKRTPSCSSCQRHVFFCSLCGLPVRGAANACLACGHGGHLTHMMDWFQNHNECPSGCGCPCLQKTRSILEYIK